MRRLAKLSRLQPPSLRPCLRRGLLVPAAILAGCLAAAPADPAPAAAGGGEETWYVLELGGRPAGWSVTRWWRDGERVVTEEEMSLRLARGESTLEVALAGRFEETPAGEPLSLWTRQELGSEPVETTYRYLDHGLEAVRVQAGRERRELHPLPEGDWLAPAAARRAAAARHAAGDRRYELRSVELLEGPDPVTTLRIRLEDSGGPGGAGSLAGADSRWREETSSAPGVSSIVELDADGGLVRSSTELFGLEAVAYRSDRESALAAAMGRGEGGPGPEVLVRTLVRPDRPIPGHRRATRAVYDLSLADGEPMPALPGGGAQRVAPQGAGNERLRVSVYREPADAPPLPPYRPRPEDADPVPGASAESGASAAITAGHLAPSLYLDHQDPEVRRLLAAVPRSGADDPAAADDAERSRRLTRFVHGYIDQKNLGTGFATASEVARSRRGDCTEHAVLLAALLRAEGIPSRVVTGLVYLDDFAGAENVFGYHMWVQAAVGTVRAAGDGPADSGRQWVDLDPTLAGGFDVTHIALGHSDLSGAGPDQRLDRLVPLIGKLRIAVIEVEAPAAAPPGSG